MFQSLRMIWRFRGHKPMIVERKDRRRATILGIGPEGKSVVGWLDGTTALKEFDPDEVEWKFIAVFED